MKYVVAALCGAACASVSAQDYLGAWSGFHDWKVEAIQMALLPPDGNLVIWGVDWISGTGPEPDTKTRFISPGTDWSYSSVIQNGSNNYFLCAETNLFCVGLAPWWNGTLLTAGGHTTIYNGYGDERVNLVNTPSGGNVWNNSTNVLTQFRWYPTVLMSQYRRMYVFAGTHHTPNGAPGAYELSPIPETWVLGPSWHSNLGEFSAALPSHTNMDLGYPHMFVNPKTGRLLFRARGGGYCEEMDLATLTWSSFATPSSSIDIKNEYPSSVLIIKDLGSNSVYRLVSSGGADDYTHSATDRMVYCDLNATSPSWVSGANMYQRRQNHVLVGLPNLDIISMGGNDIGLTRPTVDPEDLFTGHQSRNTPELWNTFSPTTGSPAGNAWTPLATPSDWADRGYHFTALLNPDATIVEGGGEPSNVGASPPDAFGNQRYGRVFSPPYGSDTNWHTASHRPTLGTDGGVEMHYGESYDITATPATNWSSPSHAIDKMVLVSMGAVTHAFIANQRVVEVTWTRPDATNYPNLIRITPPSTKVAPPGYYMLFAVDNTDLGSDEDQLTRIKGIPSKAKIVQLKDWDQVFGDRVDVLAGDTGTRAIGRDQVLLSENTCLAQYIYCGVSEGSYVAVEMEGTAPTYSSYDGIRVWAESKASGSIGVHTISLWDWTTSEYVQVGSNMVGDLTGELLREKSTTTNVSHYVSTSANGPPAPGIDHVPYRVRAYIDWTAEPYAEEYGPTGPITVYLDMAEIGIRGHD